MFLAVRSFNSLHIARQLLERGYYQQASALVRMAMEDQLVSEDAETHPPTLDALLDDKGSISSGDLTYGKMAERISPEAKKAWDEKYGDLSERAAHPRRLSLLALTTVRRTVRPGGHYDEVQVKVTFLYLLEQLGQVLRTVGLLIANVGCPWVEGARPALRDMTVLYREIIAQLRTAKPGSVPRLRATPFPTAPPSPAGTLLSSNLEWTQTDRPRVPESSVSIEAVE